MKYKIFFLLISCYFSSASAIDLNNFYFLGKYFDFEKIFDFNNISVEVEAQGIYNYINNDLLLPDSPKYSIKQNPLLGYKLNFLYEYKLLSVSMFLLKKFKNKFDKNNLVTNPFNRAEVVSLDTKSDIILGLIGSIKFTKKVGLYGEYSFREFQTKFSFNENFKYQNSTLFQGKDYVFSNTYEKKAIGVSLFPDDHPGLTWTMGYSTADMRLPFVHDNIIETTVSSRTGSFIKLDYTNQNINRVFGVRDIKLKMEFGMVDFYDRSLDLLIEKGLVQNVSSNKYEFNQYEPRYIINNYSTNFALYKNISMNIETEIRNISAIKYNMDDFTYQVVALGASAVGLFSTSLAIDSLKSKENSYQPYLNVILQPLLSYSINKLLTSKIIQQERVLTIGFNMRW